MNRYKIERGFDVNRRINIPKKILDELGIKEDAVMILYVEGNKIVLEKIKEESPSDGN